MESFHLVYEIVGGVDVLQLFRSYSCRLGRLDSHSRVGAIQSEEGSDLGCFRDMIVDGKLRSWEPSCLVVLEVIDISSQVGLHNLIRIL